MSIFEAILLGLIQGLTEFIPVSSTAHLILTAKFLQLNKQFSPEQLTAFNAVIQLGTLLAVIVYFARDLQEITTGFFVENLNWKKNNFIDPSSANFSRLGWLIILGTLPIVFFGLAFKKQIEGIFTKNLYVIGSAMIGLALVLMLAEFIGKKQRTIFSLTWFDALIVGIAQAFALIPGSSRSGTTITGCLFLGLTRETAARFSFLLSIPAVAAAGIFELLKEWKHLNSDLFVAVVIATLVAFISGYSAIAFLMYYLKSHSTFVFIAYRLILGIMIFVLLSLKVTTPT